MITDINLASAFGTPLKKIAVPGVRGSVSLAVNGICSFDGLSLSVKKEKKKNKKEKNYNLP